MEPLAIGSSDAKCIENCYQSTFCGHDIFRDGLSCKLHENTDSRYSTPVPKHAGILNQWCDDPNCSICRGEGSQRSPSTTEDVGGGGTISQFRNDGLESQSQEAIQAQIPPPDTAPAFSAPANQNSTMEGRGIVSRIIGKRKKVSKFFAQIFKRSNQRQ
ncbi:hypothetical protein SBOR_1093 [Sclerotinia borealis F-4128]|uniref:Uncharacterized protein n=1 Tax=Sclerotinia borealis (strain F-4128) TaxID=1432307 RepID=W9CRF5_SCLBF|nr:hypothetical protein SBOR_1093 [Sclerotinia borealis F-4128]